MEQVLTLPIHVQSALLRDKKLTARQLVRQHLDEISRKNDYLHTFTEVFYEQAEAAAETADLRIRSGKGGPLCGIPLAVKDIIDVAGHVTSLGSASSAAYKAKANAMVVHRLQAAGMIPVGKVHTVEFAYGAWGTNEHLGAPRNPLSTTGNYVAGGSSSGSAAAVAGHLASGALGTDTGGSVRIPSAFCGLVGLRPSLGRVPTNGIHSLSPSLDTVGPMARCVQDTALMFDAMMGEKPRSYSLNKSILKGLSVAVMTEAERVLVHADVLENYDRSIQTLKDAGAVTHPLPLPYALPDLATITTRMIAIEGYPPIRHIIDNPGELVDSEVRARFLEAKDCTLDDYLDILQLRHEIELRFAEALKDFDLYLTPTTIGTAVLLSDAPETKWTPAMFTRFVSLTGRPALALPNGHGADSMPTSLQLIGHPHSERSLLAVGGYLEEIQ